jgi:hypothetical protein
MLFFKPGSHHIAYAGLELLGSSDPPIPASQVLGFVLIILFGGIGGIYFLSMAGDQTQPQACKCSTIELHSWSWNILELFLSGILNQPSSSHKDFCLNNYLLYSFPSK